jgi:hypothetical protein
MQSALTKLARNRPGTERGARAAARSHARAVRIDMMASAVRIEMMAISEPSIT